ncbi:MAG TPA: methyltransferase domain-containing protein [Dokdonella sp.]|uniref:class I SAM-dependent methyltransferase n=1 Tax=Dokdonella sp. TaxID=2291710 RepID=UPI002D8069EB|nr:methyltransferase domain-containing protein [Dokdonella sp.]HET9034467.1 methyltransferase domain-containing protein [Dokdonella sp.]
MKKLSLAVALALALTACGPAAEQPAAPESTSDQPAVAVPPAAANPIDSILAGAWRSDANKARDTYRHPAATLAFFGVKPDQTIVEIAPGGGWYTEILAPLLMKDGHYIAAIATDASSEYNARNNAKFREKLAGDAAQYGAAKTVEFDPEAPNFGPDGSADVVLTFRNVHNWVGGGNAEAMFKGFNAVLKPGGTLGVVEHRAADGADPASIEKSGYLTTDSVIKLATDAGFTLVEQSEINANPNDTKDYEKGVWTLPPGLALGETDRDKYLAIGESDRMTLKFVKPKADQIFEQGTDSGDPDAGNE